MLSNLHVPSVVFTSYVLFLTYDLFPFFSTYFWSLCQYCYKICTFHICSQSSLLLVFNFLHNYLFLFFFSFLPISLSFFRFFYTFLEFVSVVLSNLPVALLPMIYFLHKLFFHFFLFIFFFFFCTFLEFVSVVLSNLHVPFSPALEGLLTCPGLRAADWAVFVFHLCLGCRHREAGNLQMTLTTREQLSSRMHMLPPIYAAPLRTLLSPYISVPTIYTNLPSPTPPCSPAHAPSRD